ncbi:hypothetical protein MTO96_041775 [Rhipicephalus appendiculatus]
MSSWLVHHWRSTRRNYVRIKEIKVGEKVYNVTAYYSAGDGYCKGAIRNVDRKITEQELDTMIVHSGNPIVMQAKRIKDTGSVVIVFEGYEVPNHIKFGSVLLKCYLYWRQVDVCYICAKIPQTHTSVERSASYAERVIRRVDRNCKQRYQTPFIVRQRRRERTEESTRELQPPGRFEDFPPIEELIPTAEPGRYPSLGVGWPKVTMRPKAWSSPAALVA